MTVEDIAGFPIAGIAARRLISISASPTPELILFGVRGKNARTLAPGRRQVNYLGTRKREHSRKADPAASRAALDGAASPAPCR